MWEHPTEDHQPEGLLQNENEYIYSQCNARQARSTQRNAHRFPFALPFVAASPFFFFGLSTSESSDSPRVLAACARFESAAM